jgi:hypothetical protein
MKRAAIALLALLSCAHEPPFKCVEGSGTTYEFSQEVGEAKLKDLAALAVVEDAWVYRDSLWTDVGFMESPYTVHGDNTLIRSEAKKTDVLHMYHNHIGWSPPSYADFLSYRQRAADIAPTVLVSHVITGRGLWTYGTTGLFSPDSLFGKEYDRQRRQKNFDHSAFFDSLPLHGMQLHYKKR